MNPTIENWPLGWIATATWSARKNGVINDAAACSMLGHLAAVADVAVTETHAVTEDVAFLIRVLTPHPAATLERWPAGLAVLEYSWAAYLRGERSPAQLVADLGELAAGARTTGLQRAVDELADLADLVYSAAAEMEMSALEQLRGGVPLSTFTGHWGRFLAGRASPWAIRIVLHGLRTYALWDDQKSAADDLGFLLDVVRGMDEKREG